MPDPFLRRALAFAATAVAVAATGLAGQSLGDPLVPRGRLRLRMDPVYTIWDSRFGRRVVDGAVVEERERLGSDLTDPTGTSLFPGVRVLESGLRTLTGDPSYVAQVGSVRGMIDQQITRIDFGADVGIFDWLTVGFTVPWLRTETTVEVAYRPDPALVDLGINPAIAGAGESEQLLFFLQELRDAATATRLDADATCASSPASPECGAAMDLAGRAEGMHTGLETAYFASPFFPLAESTVAGSLSAAVQALSQDLTAAGHSGIATPVIFSSTPVTQENFEEFPTAGPFGIGGAPLGHLRSLWGYGDVEIGVAARILASLPDSASPDPRIAYALSGSVLVRLPTGERQDPDVFLDLGWGEGQTDVEAELHGLVRTARLGLVASARYGWQSPATIVRRVAPPEIVMPPLDTRRTVRWSPAAYVGVDVSPRFRLNDALSAVAEYRLFTKGRDTFQVLDASASPGTEPDPSVLEAESRMTMHQAGIGLSYTTLSAWRAGRAPTPVELDFRVVRAVAGTGGQTPVWTRMELALRLFRRLWG